MFKNEITAFNKSRDINLQEKCIFSAKARATKIKFLYCTVTPKFNPPAALGGQLVKAIYASARHMTFWSRAALSFYERAAY